MLYIYKFLLLNYRLIYTIYFKKINKLQYETNKDKLNIRIQQ